MKGARARAAILGGALLVSYAWFYQAGGWNQNTRFDLVRAVVEQGTLRIDDYRSNTGDLARAGGHWYTDKAPGQSFAAVPVVLALRPAVRLLGADPASPAGIAALSWGATVATAALPVVIAALLLVRLGRRLGAGEGGGAFAAVAMGLATPMWAYATLFWGHPLSAGCLVAAFAAAAELGDAGSRRRDLLLSAAAGGTAAWAAVTEFPSAPAAAGIAVLLLHQARGRGALVRCAAAAGGAAAAVFLLLFWYNWQAFGSILSTGYSNVYGWDVKEGVRGVTWPKPAVLWSILFGTRAGLLALAPALAAAPVGLVLARRRAPAAVAAAAFIAAYYLLFNAAYKFWGGGWSYGPRHLSPAIPFLCLGLAPLWSRAPAWGRGLLAAGALAGFARAFVVVATTAQTPEEVERPWRELHWPAFMEGDVSLNHQSFLEPYADYRTLRGGTHAHDAWNLGEKLGLRGRASLFPLVLLQLLAAAGWLVTWLRSTSVPNRPPGKT